MSCTEPATAGHRRAGAATSSTAVVRSPIQQPGDRCPARAISCCAGWGSGTVSWQTRSHRFLALPRNRGPRTKEPSERAGRLLCRIVGARGGRVRGHPDGEAAAGQQSAVTRPRWWKLLSSQFSSAVPSRSPRRVGTSMACSSCPTSSLSSSSRLQRSFGEWPKSPVGVPESSWWRCSPSRSCVSAC